MQCFDGCHVFRTDCYDVVQSIFRWEAILQAEVVHSLVMVCGAIIQNKKVVQHSYFFYYLLVQESGAIAIARLPHLL